MMACEAGHKEVVQLFLNHSYRTIDLNASDNDGCTAFMLVCEKGHIDVVKLFLEYSDKIDLNARDNEGYTALMLAPFGHRDIVNLLMECSKIKNF